MPGSDPDADPALELRSRRTIYQHVRDNPGIHFRALLVALEYAQGTLQYHLRRLETQGLLEKSDDGKYTRYYPAEEFDEEDQAVMNALRREYARRIIAHLAVEGALSTADLSDRLERSPSTVSWHLSKLEDADLVTKERKGRSVEYALCDPERVQYLYTVHRRTFTDRVVDRLFDLWDSY
ncbi:metalloregulator ArsR/SmtB family transcription factor [Natrinema thermotolerans]|uniref:Metalloregulator ArsR/SmtB family transcription factor n=1 Tax=Natrinema thermotolerans TaxID=121872 RepID=A0AAF0T5U1_9EURY|nr:metalloregulator ArsR/SmtB family transcription factor [Natrinema thermotolerans]QCC61700.1 winged helix-turn-helix transcriptional regulator [Natrinema thermotolerans]WMT07879.1 metalloregulator ArsR/SmtB family transcription factor [Natrinema thermotolerans]